MPSVYFNLWKHIDLFVQKLQTISDVFVYHWLKAGQNEPQFATDS